MAPDSDEIVIKFDGQQLIGLFLIIIVSFFVLISYVNALTSFQPSFVSQYSTPKPSPRPPIITYPPVADAGPDQDVIIYEVVFFNGSGSKDDGEIKSYSWNFGDGTSASGAEVTHKYTSVGIFTATLTVKDNLGLTDTDTSVITVSKLSFEEINKLPNEDLAKILELLPLENSTEILMNLNSSLASNIFKELNFSVALNIIDVAIRTNYTMNMSIVLLEIENEYASEVIIELDTDIGVGLIESMMEINTTGCANVVESAVSIDLNRTAKLLEIFNNELLAELLLKIAYLPSTPQSVATIFESLSIEKVLAVAKEWISLGELQKLEEVFGFLQQETLNSIFDLLSVAERVAVYPFLSTGTVSLIRYELLPLPDIGFMPIIVSRSGSRGYNVSVVMHNHGNVNTGYFSGEFWIGGDLVDIFDVPELSPDNSSMVSFMWKPASKGVYELEAILDPENLIEEIDETNNMIFTSYGVQLPELLVAFDSVPSEFIEGKSYEFEVVVSNTGEVEANEFDILMQASGIIIEQGRVSWRSFTIGSSEIDKLHAGTSEVFDFSWEPEYSGAYTLTARVDTDERVLEGDRMNNKVELQIEVEERPSSWPYLLGSAVVVVVVVGALFLVRPQTFDFLRRLKSQEA